VVQCHSRATRVLPKHLAPRPSPGPYASSALHSDSRYEHMQLSPPGQGRVRVVRDVRPFAPPGVRLGSGSQGNRQHSGSKNYTLAESSTRHVSLAALKWKHRRSSHQPRLAHTAEAVHNWISRDSAKLQQGTRNNRFDGGRDYQSDCNEATSK